MVWYWYLCVTKDWWFNVYILYVSEPSYIDNSLGWKIRGRTSQVVCSRSRAIASLRVPSKVKILTIVLGNFTFLGIVDAGHWNAVSGPNCIDDVRQGILGHFQPQSQDDILCLLVVRFASCFQDLPNLRWTLGSGFYYTKFSAYPRTPFSNFLASPLSLESCTRVFSRSRVLLSSHE